MLCIFLIFCWFCLERNLAMQFIYIFQTSHFVVMCTAKKKRVYCVHSRRGSNVFGDARFFDFAQINRICPNFAEIQANLPKSNQF